MRPKKKTIANSSISRRVWGCIRGAQTTLELSDEQLCDYLDVSKRTLSNYDRDPSKMSLKKLERMQDCIGLNIKVSYENFEEI